MVDTQANNSNLPATPQSQASQLLSLQLLKVSKDTLLSNNHQLDQAASNNNLLHQVLDSSQSELPQQALHPLLAAHPPVSSC